MKSAIEKSDTESLTFWQLSSDKGTATNDWRENSVSTNTVGTVEHV